MNESAVSLGDFAEKALLYYAFVGVSSSMINHEAGIREQSGTQTLSVGWSVRMPFISALSIRGRGMFVSSGPAW